MNSLLIFPEELSSSSRAKIVGARAAYAFFTHELREGVHTKCVVYEGGRGEAQVIQASPEIVELEVTIHLPPRPRAGRLLLIAVPRPQAVKHILRGAAMLGVDGIHFVRGERTEKSYLQSKTLTDEGIRQQILYGLEQSYDSAPPEVGVHRAPLKRALEIIEERLREIQGWSEPLRFVAHPPREESGAQELTVPLHAPRPTKAILAIGPESGWTEDEISIFRESGYSLLHLGERAMRTETAVVFGLGLLHRQGGR